MSLWCQNQSCCNTFHINLPFKQEVGPDCVTASSHSRAPESPSRAIGCSIAVSGNKSNYNFDKIVIDLTIV